MAKYYASRWPSASLSQAVEIYGGYGFMKDYPGREVLPRRQDRQDLRRHLKHAAATIAAGLINSLEL